MKIIKIQKKFFNNLNKNLLICILIIITFILIIFLMKQNNLEKYENISNNKLKLEIDYKLTKCYKFRLNIRILKLRYWGRYWLKKWFITFYPNTYQ